MIVDRDPRNLPYLTGLFSRSSARQPGFEFFQFLVLLLERGNQFAHLCQDIRRVCLQEIGQRPDLRLAMLEQFIRAFARLRLNSAHAGRHSGFSDQLKEPNLPCLSAMGAAAQFLLNASISTTRTLSPYLSPKKASAPS